MLLLGNCHVHSRADDIFNKIFLIFYDHVIVLANFLKEQDRIVQQFVNHMLNHPDAYSILLGFVAGLFSTLLMTLIELPSWKRWGLHGVFEWHENQVIITKVFKLASDKTHFTGIFALHFLNGGLGGIGFLIALWIFPGGISHIFISALIYGLFLWVVTLIPIHKPITGFSPWRHPLGNLPTLSSLAGHVVYAAVLGCFFMNTPF